MKVEVEYGPLSKLALVWGGPTTVWALGPAVNNADGIRVERAPHMWNITWGDPHYEAVNDFDDEYPFPLVRAELDRRIAESKKK